MDDVTRVQDDQPDTAPVAAGLVRPGMAAPRPPTAPPSPAERICFGAFELIAAERRLLRDGVDVALGSRALDILVLLVARAGAIVGKQELIAQVWGGLSVEESSLRVHISALRKTLGQGQDGGRYITNVAGRGYAFVAPVSQSHSATLKAADAWAPPPGWLAGRPACLIGRDADRRCVEELLQAHRFATIHGPGGIGKTMVALSVAEALGVRFADGVRLLDLGLLAPGSAVADGLAAALGLVVQVSDPTPSIVSHLRDRRLLLILDCCEHVIEAASALAEVVFREAPGVAILATSREPLRAMGEHVYQLPPLAMPPADGCGDAAELLRYPAARLFHERAFAGGHRVELDEVDRVVVSAICRKVDGIPLALELAAGRVGTHGLEGTATLLDGRLKLVWRGRRTAPPRHQTLHATLDWSFALVGPIERRVLCRLTVFVGPFTLDEAVAVAADPSIDEAMVIEALAGLAAQSLIDADAAGRRARYRLLDITRAYAQARLAESGEERAVAWRHARHYRDLLAASDRAAGGQPVEAAGDEAGLIANVKAALAWSFAAEGDRTMGVALAAGAVELFLRQALLGDCRRWAERALAALEPAEAGSAPELVLRSALGQALLLATRNSHAAQAELERALAIAEALGDRSHQMKLLGVLHIFYRRTGAFGRLLDTARRAEAVAAELGEPELTAVARVMVGATHNLLGEFAAARTVLDLSLDPEGRAGRLTSAFLDTHPEALFIKARILWATGYPDQALALQDEAERIVRPGRLAACPALIMAAGLHILFGDWQRAGACAENLLRLARDHALEPYESLASGFLGEVRFRQGAAETGMAELRVAIDRLRAQRFEFYISWLTGTLATGLTARGHHDQALALMREQVAQIEANGGAYNLSELLRIEGVAFAAAGDAVAAERCFARSLAVAEVQGALSWQLRTATSVAALRLRQGRPAEARAVLAPIHAQFTEGFATADLVTARCLLERL